MALDRAAQLDHAPRTMSDPFFAAFDRARVTVPFRGAKIVLHTGHGLFSADRLDEGTRLLLDHLPDRIEGRVLDVGCGYGALSLPIAAACPSAKIIAVDRDVVAVRYAARNASELGLANVEAHPSLGYDAVEARELDLVLCNIPARIGRVALAHLIGGGVRRLAPAGGARIVVIHDLVDDVESIARDHGLDGSAVARGARHTVFRFGRGAPPASEDPILYARDEVECGGLAFARPHDASEDPGHAKEGAPLLAELLPRAPTEALVWRSPHGVMATLLAKRGARVRLADRDLLALAFATKNAVRHGVKIETREAAWLPELEGTFPLVIAELSSTAGLEVAIAELRSMRARLAASGQALVLAPEKLATAVLARERDIARVVASRARWVVLRVA